MAQTNVTYLWQGADRRGNKVKGKITAQSIQEVKLLLRKQGISAQEIKKPRGNLLLRGKEKLSSEDICVITRQIATMLNAGVSVMQTLDMIAAGHAKQEARTILGAIAKYEMVKDVEGAATAISFMGACDAIRAMIPRIAGLPA